MKTCNQAYRDSDRLTFIADLVKNCPTASFHFNDDPDVEFADGCLLPVGFTIRVEGVCDPLRVTAPTFRKAVDKLERAMKKDSEYEAVPGGLIGT